MQLSYQVTMNYTPEKLLEKNVLGHTAYGFGSEGDPILFVAGPPGSAVMWATVQRRLAPRRTVAVEFPMVPKGTFADIVDRLDKIASELGSSIIVSHGEAVPFALSVGADCVRLQVITNGQLSGGTASAQVSQLPKTIITGATRLGLGSWFFRSSLGLRRAVKNPYVMDRAVVDNMIAPYFSTKEQRKGMLALFKLTSQVKDVPVSKPVHVIWGDSDRMHPKAVVEAWAATVKDVTVEYVPGGRWFYPLECPWDLADRLAQVAELRSV